MNDKPDFGKLYVRPYLKHVEIGIV